MAALEAKVAAIIIIGHDHDEGTAGGWATDTVTGTGGCSDDTDCGRLPGVSDLSVGIGAVGAQAPPMAKVQTSWCVGNSGHAQRVAQGRRGDASGVGGDHGDGDKCVAGRRPGRRVWQMAVAGLTVPERAVPRPG